MDLQINNATFEEIEKICRRIGEMSFHESLGDSKPDGKMTLEFEEPEDLLTEGDVVDNGFYITEETEKSQLHLDSYQESKEPEWDRAGMMELAKMFADQFESDALKALLRKYGAPSIPQVEEKDVDAICNEMRDRLNEAAK